MDKFDPKLYKNLISLMKMFEDRPYHLVKYLMENGAFTDQFKSSVSKNNFLDKVKEDEEDYLASRQIYFVDISQMNDFFNSLFSDIEWTRDSTPNLTKDLNTKLDNYIREERYEDAIRIRDYMNKMGIKRISPEDL